MTNILTYHLIFVAAVIWPAILICRRAGIRPVWAFALLIPMFGLVSFAAALAFQPWPTLKNKGKA